MQCHGLPNGPTNNNEERGNAECDLDAGTDSNAHGQIHLVANGDNDGSDVLSSISNNWDENETNKRLADASAFHDIIDTADEVVGTDGHENSSQYENDGGGNWAHAGLLGLFGILELSLGIEKVAVSTELEDEIDDVEEQKNNGCATRKNKDALLFASSIPLIKNTVELRIC